MIFSFIFFCFADVFIPIRVFFFFFPSLKPLLKREEGVRFNIFLNQ